MFKKYYLSLNYINKTPIQYKKSGKVFFSNTNPFFINAILQKKFEYSFIFNSIPYNSEKKYIFLI